MPAAASFSLQPASLRDVDFAADVYTDEWQDEASDPVTLRHEWTSPETGPRGRYVITDQGRRIGFAEWQHDAWELLPDPGQRYGLIIAAFFRSDFEAGRLAGVIGALESELRAEGTRVLTSKTRPFEVARAAVLEGLGYTQDREERWSELRLREAGPRLLEMAASTRRRCAEAGIALSPLLGFADDPQFMRALWRASAEAEADIPSTVPITPDTYQSFIADLENPGSPWDRVWVATREGRPLGMSLLLYPPQRGNVWTAWTFTARAARGQGLARALKLETLLQALELGIEVVRTSNDEENAPILHLNRQLGYQPVPGLRLWVKPA